MNFPTPKTSTPPVTTPAASISISYIISIEEVSIHERVYAGAARAANHAH